MDFDFIDGASRTRQKVTDEYALSENKIIGRGSYGIVYKVQPKNDENSQFFALKAIDVTPYSPSSYREIAIYREIAHRNVMKLLKIFLDNTTRKAWLVFDYAEYDLHSIIKYYRNLVDPKHDRMSEIMVKSCLWQILHGVKYLHDNWILHRDLKPENILVMGDGNERGCIKITDMGMARTFHAPLRPFADIDAIVVTCWYRAPELLLGTRHYTTAIDLFSLGCIFAELLTSVPIFHCIHDEMVQANRTPYQQSQLDKMFSVLGYPTDSDWTDLRQMPFYFNLQKDFRKSQYTNCTLTKYMKNYKYSPNNLSMKLLKKFLTMDPNRRITIADAMEDLYLTKPQMPSNDAFDSFPTNIPFPLRQYLPPKKQQTVTAPASISTVRHQYGGILVEVNQNEGDKVRDEKTVIQKWLQ